MSLSKLTL